MPHLSHPPPATLGLMCGTFDPPHHGHLAIGRSAREQLKLDQVLFLPVGQPTHKTTLTPAHHRLTMTRLAIATDDTLQLDTTDINRPPPHYTATLLPLLQAKHPAALLWLLIGADSLRDFPTWHKPQAIINSGCRLAVYDRPGVKIDWPTLEEQLPGLRDTVTMLDGDQVDISSTEVRQRAAAGQSLRGLVPPAVRSYITAHNLYARRS